jgi:hypothetical protein
VNLRLQIAIATLTASLIFSPAAIAQNTSAPHRPTARESVDSLTPEQKQQFDQAGKLFNVSKFSESLTIFKALLLAHPTDPLFSKFAAEAALNTGDRAQTLTILQSLDKSDPDDWQAVALQARAYTEMGDKPHSAAAIARLSDLYARHLVPANQTQYIIEQVEAEGRRILIWNSFVPWGNFKVHNYARVFDADGQLLLRITLESSDFDQTQFAKEHPAEAAAGARRFSLDGYRTAPPNAAGQKTETHITFAFLDSKPTYDEVRADFIKIATGKSIPMSENLHPIP